MRTSQRVTYDVADVCEVDRNDPRIREQFIEIMYELGVPTRRSILNGPSDHSSSSHAHRAVSPASRTSSSSSIIGLGQDDLTHKVPLVGTLELFCHLVLVSPFQGSHRREEDQVFAERPCRAFFPCKVQKTAVAVGEHDRALGGVGVDKFGPGASKGPSGFECEERLVVSEGDGHGGGYVS